MCCNFEQAPHHLLPLSLSIQPLHPNFVCIAIQPPHSTLACGCPATTLHPCMWLSSHHTLPQHSALTCGYPATTLYLFGFLLLLSLHVFWKKLPAQRSLAVQPAAIQNMAVQPPMHFTVLASAAKVLHVFFQLRVPNPFQDQVESKPKLAENLSWKHPSWCAFHTCSSHSHQKRHEAFPTIGPASPGCQVFALGWVVSHQVVLLHYTPQAFTTLPLFMLSFASHPQ